MLKKVVNKKAELPSIVLITAGVLGLLALGLMVVVVQIILGQIATNLSSGASATQGCGLNSSGGSAGTLLFSNCSAAINTTFSTQSSVGTIPGWFTVLITVVVAVGIILLVMILKNINSNK